MNNEDIGAVSPALEHYTKEALMHGLWKRAELSPRDRSIVTVAALIARMQSNEMPHYFAMALDNGVKPGELSEIITHLAFYSGWPNAIAAVSLAREIFQQRGIGSDRLPGAKEPLLPLNEGAEKKGRRKSAPTMGILRRGWWRTRLSSSSAIFGFVRLLPRATEAWSR